MEDKIREEITKKAKDNRLPCPVARKIAQELSVSYSAIGKAANELKIKITDCELGCF
jgi:DNA-binding transcriptional regulator YhcF (GntR family)